jgi:hypothetical protein
VIDKDRVTVVDFKFGKEKKEYENQVSTYRKLLLDMDYQLVDAFLWYVDSKKIIKVI